jgi:hypothetical protein
VCILLQCLLAAGADVEEYGAGVLQWLLMGFQEYTNDLQHNTQRERLFDSATVQLTAIARWEMYACPRPTTGGAASAALGTLCPALL